MIRGREVPAGKWGYHCERISPGCQHCYASTMNKRMLPAWGTGLDYTVPNREKVEIFLDEHELLKPLRWRKPRRIFVESMSDWCAEFVTDEMRDRVMAVAALCPHHTFLFLTKRADRCAEWALEQDREDVIDTETHNLPGSLDETWHYNLPLPNVWLGFSAENQQYFDIRWRHMRLLAAAGWNVWCSAEPLLSAIDICTALRVRQAPEEGDDIYEDRGHGLHWLVVGGESGHGARPCNIGWIRSLVDECRSAGVACFVKQLGAKPYDRIPADAHVPQNELYIWKLRHRKGGNITEWPEDLRVREIPGGTR